MSALISIHPMVNTRVSHYILREGPHGLYPVLQLGNDATINLGNHPDPALYLHHLADVVADALYALAQAEAEQAARPPIGEPA